MSHSIRYVLLTVASLFILSKLTIAASCHHNEVEKRNVVDDLLPFVQNLAENLKAQVLKEFANIVSHLTGKPVTPIKGDFEHQINNYTGEIVHTLSDLKADDDGGDDLIQGIESVIKFLAQAVATIAMVVSGIANAVAGAGNAVSGIGGAIGGDIGMAVKGVGGAIAGIASAVGFIAGAVVTIANAVAGAA